MTTGTYIHTLRTRHPLPHTHAHVFASTPHSTHIHIPLTYTLRYIIGKNPETAFVGYSIPHPAEKVMNIGVQTNSKYPAPRCFLLPSP